MDEPTATPNLLTPERLEEIRATLVKRLADERRRAKKDGTQPYQTVVSMAEGDDLVTALAHIAAQAEQIQELTAQRDHYHTEWTARGTALLQLHQDIEAEQRRVKDLREAIGAFSQEDLRVLDMAEYRYGFCPRTESCVGCDKCDAEWERFITVRPRLAALLTFITPTA